LLAVGGHDSAKLVFGDFYNAVEFIYLKNVYTGHGWNSHWNPGWKPPVYTLVGVVYNTFVHLFTVIRHRSIDQSIGWLT